MFKKNVYQSQFALFMATVKELIWNWNQTKKNLMTYYYLNSSCYWAITLQIKTVPCYTVPLLAPIWWVSNLQKYLEKNIATIANNVFQILLNPPRRFFSNTFRPASAGPNLDALIARQLLHFLEFRFLFGAGCATVSPTNLAVYLKDLNLLQY